MQCIQFFPFKEILNKPQNIIKSTVNTQFNHIPLSCTRYTWKKEFFRTIPVALYHYEVFLIVLENLFVPIGTLHKHIHKKVL